MTTLRSTCLLVLLCTGPGAGWAGAQAPAAKLVPGQSEIAFQIRQSGVPVDGRFARFDAQLALDPKAPQTGTVTISIDTASATVGFAESDAELPRAPWFNAPKFPRAVFQSSSIKALGGGRFEVAGKLALKGATQDRVVPVTLTQAGALSTASGEFVVKRLDFKIGENEWADVSLVANDVRVKFKLVSPGWRRSRVSYLPSRISTEAHPMLQDTRRIDPRRRRGQAPARTRPPTSSIQTTRWSLSRRFISAPRRCAVACRRRKAASCSTRRPGAARPTSRST